MSVIFKCSWNASRLRNIVYYTSFNQYIRSGSELIQALYFVNTIAIRGYFFELL